MSSSQQTPSIENVNTFEPRFKERELKSAKSHLKHAEIHDTSAPLIEKDVHIQENHHKDLFVEIQQPHDLKHTETHDKSAPVIDSDIHLHKSATLRLKENVAHAKDVIVENVEKAKEKLVENVQWAKEKLEETAHNAKEVVTENVVYAKESAGKTKETLAEGLKDNAEAAKEKMAHNAAYAKVKLSNINAPGGVPVPPPSHPHQPVLPPQPSDQPHHEQAFTEKNY